jgi:hypothetical protein
MDLPVNQKVTPAKAAMSIKIEEPWKQADALHARAAVPPQLTL